MRSINRDFLALEEVDYEKVRNVLADILKS